MGKPGSSALNGSRPVFYRLGRIVTQGVGWCYGWRTLAFYECNLFTTLKWPLLVVYIHVKAFIFDLDKNYSLLALGHEGALT